MRRRGHRRSISFSWSIGMKRPARDPVCEQPTGDRRPRGCGDSPPGRPHRSPRRAGGPEYGPGRAAPNRDQARADDGTPARRSSRSRPPVRMAGSEGRSDRNRSIKDFRPHPRGSINDATMLAQERKFHIRKTLRNCGRVLADYLSVGDSPNRFTASKGICDGRNP